MQNWDSGSGTCGTGTAVLGHAELGHAELGQFDCFLIFCDMNVERKFFFAIVCNLIVVVVTNTTVESLR